MKKNKELNSEKTPMLIIMLNIIVGIVIFSVIFSIQIAKDIDENYCGSFFIEQKMFCKDMGFNVDIVKEHSPSSQKEFINCKYIDENKQLVNNYYTKEDYEAYCQMKNKLEANKR